MTLVHCWGRRRCCVELCLLVCRTGHDHSSQVSPYSMVDSAVVWKDRMRSPTPWIQADLMTRFDGMNGGPRGFCSPSRTQKAFLLSMFLGAFTVVWAGMGEPAVSSQETQYRWLTHPGWGPETRASMPKNSSWQQEDKEVWLRLESPSWSQPKLTTLK